LKKIKEWSTDTFRADLILGSMGGALLTTFLGLASYTFLKYFFAMTDM